MSPSKSHHAMSIPDYTSPIVGYRVLTWGNTGLKSLCGKQWHPGQALEARCKASAVVGTIAGRTERANDTHDAHLWHLRSQRAPLLPQQGYDRFGIHGEVYLWGKVVEHQLGYRAQFAYPKSLVIAPDMLPFSSAPIQDLLRGLVAYGIDIFVADDNGSIPLWTKHSGLNSGGLDYLKRDRTTSIPVAAIDMTLDRIVSGEAARGVVGHPNIRLPPAELSKLPNEPKLALRETVTIGRVCS